MSKSISSILLDCAKLAVAIIVMTFMVILAKVAQYAAVEQLGHHIGFGPASLLAIIPIVLFYFWLARRLPPVTLFGRTYG